MKLSSFTSVASEINAVFDSCPRLKLSFTEVRAAARSGTLIELLAHRFGNQADFSILLSDEDELTDVDLAISDATHALDRGDAQAIDVSSNGFSLAMALVRGAIDQQFPMRVTSPSAPCPSE